MITEGQRLLITNMVNTELKNISNSVYCENELIALKQALNIDDVNQRFSEAVGEITSEGLECGIEDCNITDRYEAMQYGFEQCKERADEAILNVG